MHRRHALAVAAGLGLSGLAGCLGILGEDLTEFEASPGGVDPEALSETGYEETAVTEQVVEREFEAAGQSETVSVTNYLTEYEKAVELGPLGSQRAAVFTVLSSPQVSVLGQEFNPIEEMSTGDLVELVAENYDYIEDVEHEEDGEVTILDQETTVSRYSAAAQFDGQEVDVYLHITEAVETDEDLIAPIGVYPQQVQRAESDNVRQLMEAVAEEPVNDDWDDGGGDPDGGDDGTDGNDGNGSGDGGGGEGGGDGGGSEDDGGLLG